MRLVHKCEKGKLSLQEANELRELAISLRLGAATKEDREIVDYCGMLLEKLFNPKTKIYRSE